uniref:Uncharacterized protein n=1 Tax=Arundo donax TaxID=35708 RepID=A0A0A9C5T9_ARUDO
MERGFKVETYWTWQKQTISFFESKCKLCHTKNQHTVHVKQNSYLKLNL